MQDLSPDHELHRRVEWPYALYDAVAPIPTPLISHLDSNIPPYPNEVTKVKRFRALFLRDILKCRDKEERIRAQIRNLELHLTEVQSSRLTLEKKAFVCDVIASPFRRLPDDVIHEIVQHCPLYIRRSDDKGVSHIPSTLANVCRSFRKAVLGQSSLWREVRLTWPVQKNPMDRFNLFVSRSRSLPLSIILVTASSSEAQAGVMSFLEHIFADGAIMQRLEGLEIMTSPACCQRLLHRMHRQRFPNLRTLLLAGPPREEPEEGGIIDIMDEAEGEDLLYVRELVGNAPQLARLSLGGSHINLWPRVDNQNLGQFAQWGRGLTVLRITSTIDATALTYFLFMCPQLVKAWFIISPSGRLLVSSVVPLSANTFCAHNNLQEIVLEYRRYQGHILLPFVGFRFPNLKALQFIFDGTELNFGLPNHYRHFFNTWNPFPNLDTLICGTNGVKDGFNGLVALISAASTITNLNITFGDRQCLAFFSFLNTKAWNGYLPLPNLTNLELELCPFKYNYEWSLELEMELTQLLLETYRGRSQVHGDIDVAVLDKMSVRNNPRVANDRYYDYTDVESTIMRQLSYFWRLHHEVSLLDDVDITVYMETDGLNRKLGGHLTKDFLLPFDFYKID